MTHLQHAQPVLFAQQLLAHAQALARVVPGVLVIGDLYAHFAVQRISARDAKGVWQTLLQRRDRNA